MSETYNPILGVENFKWRLWDPRPTPNASTEIVLIGEATPAVLRTGTQAIGNSDLRLGKYTQLYRVDVSERSISFKCDLPSKNPALVFHAVIQVFCAVSDSLSVIRRNIRDVRALVEPPITNALRRVGRHYDVESLDLADAAMQEALLQELSEVNRFPDGTPRFPFRFRDPSLSLSIDQSVAGLMRTTATATFQHGVNVQSVDHANALEILRLQKQREREMEETRHQLELNRVKMEFYTPILEKGNFAMLSLYLANQSQDVALVAEKLMQQKHNEFRMQMETLRLFVSEDALEGAQLAEPARKVLKQLLAMLEAGGPSGGGGAVIVETTPGASISERMRLSPDLRDAPPEGNEELDQLPEG